MRRKDREIIERSKVEDVLNSAEVIYLGLSTGDQPYVVPVNFGFLDNRIYIHCAKVGRKIDMIRANPRISFAAHTDMTIRDTDKKACDCNTSYRSAIGFGIAEMVEDFQRKKEALDIIMRHYSDKETFEYSDASIEAVGIIVIEVLELTGKQSI